ncbi:MAG: cytochrome c maturation protein CcmE, partial [Alphaproteobacteria bacterium]|nr:cytochrome c maturation protein CcmE [Alphaproteobacteria bacterium]
MRRRRKRKHYRMLAVIAGLVALGGASVLALTAFDRSMEFFANPTELATLQTPPGRVLRLGGLVEVGSVRRGADGVTVRFRVTDMKHSVPVRYAGFLPDLFREGQGIVVKGKLGAGGEFLAVEVLAK